MPFPFNAHIQYQYNQLWIEHCSATRIAQQVKTPFYCYSQASLLDNIRRAKSAFLSRGIGIHYAVKANSNLTLMRCIAEQGLGADLVSGGELSRAALAGFPANEMIFSGVGKTDAEIEQAIHMQIGQFNVESVEELGRLAQIAGQLNARVRVALRVNPDVEVNTHRHITTGRKGNKFGIDPTRVLSLYQEYAHHPHIQLLGLAMHIGSQIDQLSPYRQAITRLLSLAKEIESIGYPVQVLDLGGGFAVDYGAGNVLEFEQIAELIATETAEFEGKIMVEPGRSLVADIGVLVSQVTYVKEAEPNPFLILDAAMNDLMRPALYQAQHPLLPVIESKSNPQRRYDIVGPVCESTDTFARQYPLSGQIEAGDLMAFFGVGAYCAVMSSSYNSRALIPEVWVEADAFYTVRQRISPEAMMQFEAFPNRSTTSEPAKVAESVSESV